MRPPVAFSPLVSITLKTCGIAVVVSCLWSFALGYDWASRLIFSRYVAACLGLAALMFALSLFYSHVRKDDYLARLLMGTTIIAVAAFASLSLSYLGHTAGFSSVDSTLAAIDKRLGFDFVGYVNFAYQTPLVRDWAAIVYGHGTAGMILFTLGYLVFTQQTDEIERLLTFFAFSVLICIAIGTLFPAGSAFAFHGISPEIEQGLGTLVGASQNVYNAHVRNLDLSVLDSGLRGMVAFPSFHTVLGVMVVLYLRSNILLMLPMALCAATMIATTPLIGGHYFADVLGGITVALGCFRLVDRLAGEARAPLALAVP